MLLGLRERALESARMELAEAARAANRASDAAEEAERAWSSEAASCAGASFATIDALVEAHALVEARRSRADAAASAAKAARAAQEAAREACLRAERERRKLEIWRDKLLDLERAAEGKRERIATDEVAARTFVRSHA